MQPLSLTVAVACALTYVNMRAFVAYSGFHSFRAFYIFQVVENLAAGLAIGMLVYFSPSVAKLARAIAGVALAGLLAVSLFLLPHQLWAPTSQEQKIVLSLCGLLLGIAIPVSAFCMSRVEP
jgi:hypothetical protein